MQYYHHIIPLSASSGRIGKLLHKSLSVKSPSNGDARRKIPFAKEKSASSGRNPRGTRIAERTAKWKSVFEFLLRSFLQFHFCLVLRIDTVKLFIKSLVKTQVFKLVEIKFDLYTFNSFKSFLYRLSIYIFIFYITASFLGKQTSRNKNSRDTFSKFNFKFS